MKKSDLLFEYKEWKKGDDCVINFGVSGVIENCKYVCTTYSGGCTYFDIDVYPFLHEPENKDHWSRLSMIRSIYVEEPNDRFEGKSQIMNF
jgi:hypothetical protein